MYSKDSSFDLRPILVITFTIITFLVWPLRVRNPTLWSKVVAMTRLLELGTATSLNEAVVAGSGFLWLSLLPRWTCSIYAVVNSCFICTVLSMSCGLLQKNNCFIRTFEPLLSLLLGIIEILFACQQRTLANSSWNVADVRNSLLLCSLVSVMVRFSLSHVLGVLSNIISTSVGGPKSVSPLALLLFQSLVLRLQIFPFHVLRFWRLVLEYSHRHVLRSNFLRVPRDLLRQKARWLLTWPTRVVVQRPWLGCSLHHTL